MKRSTALTLTALLAFTLGGASPGNSTTDDHQTALAAIADIEAARSEIIKIEDSQVVGHPSFVHAAQRALNAVVGRNDREYKAADGDPGDGNGAIGNIDRLLDRQTDSLWTPAMQGAKANLLAVVVDLHDAMNEKQMEDYETDLTEALANLALVNGRPSEDGALGGVTGALANTSLGVPAGAPTVSGCSVPTRAPAYGVVNGHLAYVALPRMSASPIPKEMSVSRVVVKGDAVVLYTRQTEIVDAICRAQARASTSPRAALKVAAHLQRTRDVRRVADVGTGAQVADAPAASSPALYTTQQAHAGQAVFTANCVGCHGANLLGVAAPGVAGTEFLTTVKNNKWTLADFRTLVVENMPLNNPGTLTPTQYANVIAYLLASNCYPAGTTAFPEKETPNLAKIKMGPVPGAKPSDEKTGICAVK